jgi:signal transduction histidine kinase
MKRIWTAWAAFGLCAGAMLGVMGWGSRKLLQLDATEKRTKQEAALEENVRLALWRMETALASLLVQENARPYTAYEPAGGQSASVYVKLHFQLDPVRRPKAGTTVIEGLRSPAALKTLSAAIPRTWIRIEQSEKPAVGGAAMPAPSPREAAVGETAANTFHGAQNRPSGQSPAVQSQMARNAQEFFAREQVTSQNAFVPDRAEPPSPPNTPRQAAAQANAVEIRTGVLTPVWLGDELVLARHVQVGARELVQGCWLDRARVRSALLASIGDLLPGSDLIPERGAFDPAEGRTLTALPLRLVPGPVRGTVNDERSPLLFSLKVAWGCMVLAILSVGLLLGQAISLSQRRAAFVSSVTHELRSPLTSFRMYTEMLVYGMATDPAKQSQYHQTLFRESDRLVHLVENVLSYARLERGRYGEREPISIGDLMGRTRGRLTDHARLADMQLLVNLDGQAGASIVDVDASAIERILFNLVDNACKYARSATDRRIHLDVSSEDRRVRIVVRDHGPGIERRRTRRLFKPFRKTVKEAAQSAAGVGIGLSLSRRLARAAGGRLSVVDCRDGACLRLDLPVAAS